MGRAPVPTKLKILRGTAQPCRINKNEADPVVTKPDAPDYLDEVGTGEWKRLVDEPYSLGLMSNLDVATLAAYCSSYSVWIKAERELSHQDLTVTTEKGAMIQNPLLGIINVAKRDCVKYAIQFGLTPSSRSKVTANKSTQKSEWDEL